jgi:hypothetical protein
MSRSQNALSASKSLDHGHSGATTADYVVGLCVLIHELAAPQK